MRMRSCVRVISVVAPRGNGDGEPLVDLRVDPGVDILSHARRLGPPRAGPQWADAATGWPMMRCK